MRSISQAILFLAGVHLCIAAAFSGRYEFTLLLAGILICGGLFVVWLFDVNSPGGGRRDSSADRADDDAM